jgi:hypothetical protein
MSEVDKKIDTQFRSPITHPPDWELRENTPFLPLPQPSTASSHISSERVVCPRLPSVEFPSFWTMLGYYTTPSLLSPAQEKQVVFLRFSYLRFPIFSIFLQDILSLSTQVA